MILRRMIQMMNDDDIFELGDNTEYTDETFSELTGGKGDETNE